MPAKVAATQAAERDLWVGHIFWVREVVRGLAQKNQAAADFAEKQVVANAKQIAGSIEPFYGKAATDQLFKLLAGHYTAIKAHATATVAGDAAGQKKAIGELTSQCQRDREVSERRQSESSGSDFEEPARGAWRTSRAAESAVRGAGHGR